MDDKISTKTIAQSLIDFFEWDRGYYHLYSPNGRYLYLNPHMLGSEKCWEITFEVSSWLKYRFWHPHPGVTFSLREKWNIRKAYKAWMKKNDIRAYGIQEKPLSARKVAREYGKLL